MTSSWRRGARLAWRGGALAFLACMTFAAAAPANAQDGDGDDAAPRGRALYPPGAVVQPLTENAGADLRRYMTQIARDPRDLGRLLQERFGAIPAVRSTRSTIALGTLKESTRLDVPLAADADGLEAVETPEVARV